jgi:hypothetical protein
MFSIRIDDLEYRIIAIIGEINVRNNQDVMMVLMSICVVLYISIFIVQFILFSLRIDHLENRILSLIGHEKEADI